MRGIDLALLDERRLLALETYRILDTPPDPVIDGHLRVAAEACRLPIGVVAFLTTDSLWIKARLRFPFQDLDLDHSVCKYMLAGAPFLLIPDLRADPRTADNPLVTGPTGARFYAAVPLRSDANGMLGSLSLMDTVPHRPDDAAPFLSVMADRAAAVMAHLASRRIGDN